MNFNEYKKTFYDKIDILIQISRENEIELPSFDSILKKIDRHTFDVAIVGEFSAGKSTLINALLGEDLLPSLLEPTTAKITYVSYSDTPKIIIKYNDGRTEQNYFDRDLLKTLVAENISKIAEISEILVEVDREFLKSGIRIIDTPGTNDSDDQRIKITYDLLPTADAVVFVISSPITSTSLSFFKEHIVNNHLKNIFCVINKKDLLGSKYSIVEQEVKENIKNIFPELDAQIISVSSLDFLEGTLLDDDELIEKSSFKEFKDKLIEFLKGEKKYINLIDQYKLLLAKSKYQLIEILRFKMQALEVPEETFESRKAQLTKDMEFYNEQTSRMKSEFEMEFNQLFKEIDRSLSTLFSGIQEKVAEIFNSRVQNIESLFKEIESTVKFELDSWRHYNQPIIDAVFNSAAEEAKIRLLTYRAELNRSLLEFGKAEISLDKGKSSHDGLAVLMNDDLKAQTASTVAVVAGMFLLTTIGVFAPIAFVIGPLFSSFRKKWLKDQIENIRSQVFDQLRDGFIDFKNEIFSQLESREYELFSRIEEGFNSFTVEIARQFEVIEQERSIETGNIKAKVQEYDVTIRRIQNIFIDENGQLLSTN